MSEEYAPLEQIFLDHVVTGDAPRIFLERELAKEGLKDEKSLRELITFHANDALHESTIFERVYEFPSGNIRYSLNTETGEAHGGHVVVDELIREGKYKSEAITIVTGSPHHYGESIGEIEVRNGILLLDLHNSVPIPEKWKDANNRFHNKPLEEVTMPFQTFLKAYVEQYK